MSRAFVLVSFRRLRTVLVKPSNMLSRRALVAYLNVLGASRDRTFEIEMQKSIPK